MGQFEDRIKEIELEIEKLQEEKLSLQILDIKRQSATVLHENICPLNHIDECEWFHEIKDGIVDWEGVVHKSWLQKAEHLIRAGYRIPDVVRIKDIMEF